jgi:hypothetical protein
MVELDPVVLFVAKYAGEVEKKETFEINRARKRRKDKKKKKDCEQKEEVSL